MTNESDYFDKMTQEELNKLVNKENVRDELIELTTTNGVQKEEIVNVATEKVLKISAQLTANALRNYHEKFENTGN